MKETEIISKTVIIDNSDEKVFGFLSDMKNIEKLVPPDIEDWSCSTDTCSFTFKGQTISLRIVEREPFKTIKIAGDEAFSSKFTFWIQLKRIGDYKVASRIVVRARLNMIEKAAVKKPLQNGIDNLVDYLKIIPY